MTTAISIDHQTLTEFCLRNHIRKLSLFGSALRDDFGPDSDVDLLVEFQPDAVVGYMELVEMQFELSDMLDQKVDLRTPAELSRHFRQNVLDSAEVLYACG